MELEVQAFDIFQRGNNLQRNFKKGVQQVILSEVVLPVGDNGPVKARILILICLTDNPTNTQTCCTPNIG